MKETIKHFSAEAFLLASEHKPNGTLEEIANRAAAITQLANAVKQQTK